MPDQEEHQEVVSVSDATNDTTEAGTDSGGNSEAAKYRRRLRDTETERDNLAGRLSVLQRAEIERHAGGYLENPGDLWLTGTEVKSMLNDSGDVDPAKVAEVAQSVVKDRPHWRAGQVTIDRDQGQKGGPAPVGWSDILSRR